MSDLSITAASVKQGDGAVTVVGTAGETITAGQNVYKSSTTNKWMKADSNSATAEARTPTGIALNGAALDQPVTVQKSGKVTIGATLTAGVAYYQSDTAGGICPVADVGSGEYATVIGIATSTTELAIDFVASGVAL
jgi:hypothetical protein